MKEDALDRKTLFLMANGDLPVINDQRLYEYAWSQGIRAVNEDELKPDFLIRKRRRGPRLKAA
jgi:hypothetical protein